MDLRFLFPLTFKSLIVLEVHAFGSGTDLGPRLDILGMLEVDAFGSGKDLGSPLGILEVDVSGSGIGLGCRLDILDILEVDADSGTDLGILGTFEVGAPGSGTSLGSDPRLGITIIG